MSILYYRTTRSPTTCLNKCQHKILISVIMTRSPTTCLNKCQHKILYQWLFHIMLLFCHSKQHALFNSPVFIVLLSVQCSYNQHVFIYMYEGWSRHNRTGSITWLLYEIHLCICMKEPNTWYSRDSGHTLLYAQQLQLVIRSDPTVLFFVITELNLIKLIIQH